MSYKKAYGSLNKTSLNYKYFKIPLHNILLNTKLTVIYNENINPYNAMVAESSPYIQELVTCVVG